MKDLSNRKYRPARIRTPDMTSEETPAGPESRIGYGNNYYLPKGYAASSGNRLLSLAAEAGNDKSTESSTGLGVDDLGLGQSVGYLDYFQNDNIGLTGIGLRRRLALQRALRRRNGAAAAAGVGGGLGAGGAGAVDSAGLNSIGSNSIADLTGAGALGGGLGAAGLTGLNDRSQGLLGLGSSGYGNSGYGYEPAISGYGLGPSQQCKSGLNPLLTLLTLAVAAAGFYFLYTKLTSLAGRKKRDDSGHYLDDLADTFFNGSYTGRNKLSYKK